MNCRAKVVLILCVSYKMLFTLGFPYAYEFHMDAGSFLFLSIVLHWLYLFHTKYCPFWVFLSYLQCFCWVFFYYISCIILPIFVINIFATLYETFFHYRIALKFHFSASNFKRIAMIIKTRRQFVFGKIKRRCFNYVDCYDM